MSEYNKTILTNQGLDLMSRANKGTAKFTITRAATSTEQLANKSMADLQQLTELPSLMQYGIINNVADSLQDSGIVIGVELVFNNKDLGNGYNINTIGLFAKEDGQDKEILYAITTAITPEFMPDYKNKVLFKFNLTMFVVVGRTDKVTVSVDNSDSASKAELDKVKNELDGKANLTDVYSKNKVDELVAGAGQTKSVNNRKPDSTGNIDLGDLFDQKADKSSVYTKEETYTKAEINEKVGDQVHSVTVNGHSANANGDIDLSDIFDQKADSNNVYSKTETDDKLAGKANSSDVYSKDQVDEKLSHSESGIKTIDGYSPDSNGNMNLGGTYDTIKDVDNKLAEKANNSDVYTQTQINNKLAIKANSSDVYTQSEADNKFGGAIKSIDGYYPDSQGRYYLGGTYDTINSVNSKLSKKASKLSNPDRALSSWETADADNPEGFLGITQLNGSILEASQNPSAFGNVSGSMYSSYGWLIIDKGSPTGYTTYLEFLIKNGSDGLTHIYFRSIVPAANNYNDKFRQLDK